MLFHFLFAAQQRVSVEDKTRSERDEEKGHIVSVHVNWCVCYHRGRALFPDETILNSECRGGESQHFSWEKTNKIWK